MINRILNRIVPQIPSANPIEITVLIPGLLDRDYARRILSAVPRTVWSFRFDDPQENVNWHIWREWHNIPFPLQDATLTVFSTADYPVEGVAGGAAGTRCTVGISGGESDELLGLRCWHELLHGLPGIESADAMLDSHDFRAFLGRHYPSIGDAIAADPERYRHDPRPQRLFYTMLTNTFAIRTGRPQLSLPPEPRLS